MASKRKTAANQANARKSRGPRTAEGKRVSSRNSRVLGLAAAETQPPAADVEALARAFCGDTQDQELLARARCLAASELALSAVRVQKLALIERLQDPKTIALAKGDNSLLLADARLEKGQRAQTRLEALIPRILEKYLDQPDIIAQLDPYADDIAIAILNGPKQQVPRGEDDHALAEEPESAAPKERDEHDALRAAVPDLIRLERYEKRAWSRHKRALRQFVESQPTDMGSDC